MNGFLNFYKPCGMSSAYALNLIKKRFKGEKMGHMGTLDPLASGVLPVAFGKSTRLFDYLLDKDKVYVAEFTFGYETDTLDRGGIVVKEKRCLPSLEEIKGVLSSLVGEVEQIPPIYSAKNVKGMRSYELARQGIEVELKPKKVVINSIDFIEKSGENSYVFLIKCKGGTYIRSICRDLAYSLNTYATMTALERLQSGIFTKENAFHLEEIIENFNEEKMLLKPDSILTFEKINLNKKHTDDIINGRLFSLDLPNGFYSVYGDCGFIGVGKIADKILKIKSYVKD